MKTLTTLAESSRLNQCSEDAGLTPALEGQHTSLLGSLLLVSKFTPVYVT